MGSTMMEYEDRLTIRTPEGVELNLTLAGVGSRFAAAVVDAIIETVVLVAIVVLTIETNGFGAGGDWGAAILLLLVFVVFLGYDVAFEVLASGRTPGKRWNGLRVMLEGGQPIGFLASSIRNVLRLIDWLPSLYLVGVVSIVVTGKNQRVGDLVAGSIVVRERRAPSTVAPRVPAAAGPVAAPGAWDVSAITPEELAAVRRFLERRTEIAGDARHQLAATIEGRLRPKIAGAPDDLHGEPFLEQLVAVKSANPFGAA
jgi:uncharacterized RDD family membrane protein YckC